MTRRGVVWRATAGVGVVAAALAVAMRFHDGPLGPLPGGALRAGAWVEPPFEWASWAAGPTLELETRPAAPRSVTTWFVVHEGALHASADFLNPGKRWPDDALADPRVVVRVRDAAGTLRRARVRATRVEAPGEIAALREAFRTKYGIEAGDLAARVRVWFFRLDPPAGGAPASGKPAEP